MNEPHEEPPAPQVGAAFTSGAAFLFDQPAVPPALWGAGREILWPDGEALMICGSPGVGKTTLVGQIVRARIFGGDVLGYPVARTEDRVLYLAMDRPKQIARALRRHFKPEDRAEVGRRLVVHQGPPPADMAKNPHMLLLMALKAGATTVVVDSLKDAAIGLSEDAVGAGYNSARQLAIASGINIIELHHQTKRGSDGGAPTSLADVYGSAWLTSGAGSVILLAGNSGDHIVDFRHLKPSMETVGPFKVLHDHEAGTSRIWGAADPIALAKATGAGGLTVAALAAELFDTADADRNQIERARRKLEALAKAGRLVKIDGGTEGGKNPARYVTPDHAGDHASLFDVSDHVPAKRSRNRRKAA